jgi:type I restriction enzyme, S subunit
MAAETIGTGRTKGRDATRGTIAGRCGLAVGRPGTNVPENWAWTELSTVADLESGHTPSRRHPEYWDGGIPWIGIPDATQNHGRTLTSTLQTVSEAGLQNSSARLLPENTVCLSRTASVGYVVKMGRPMATSQDFVNWVCGPKLVPDYLKYILLGEGDHLLRFASGTTHQTIYYPEAKAFHALLPPLNEQHGITAVLGALDDKIELNRKMNKTLEQMAQAIFKSWFIDFDGHTEFQDSLLGSIPKGWRVGNVDEATALIIDHRGKTPKKLGGDWSASGWKALSAKNIKAGELVRHDAMNFLSDALYRRWMTIQLEPGDILLTSEAPLGELYWLTDDAKYCLSQRLFALRADESFCKCAYLYYWLCCPLAQDDMRGRATGTTVVGIRQSELRKVRVLVPPIERQESFTAIATPLARRKRASTLESQTLAELRDTLLPKLISGELRIKDAEKQVGEAT